MADFLEEFNNILNKDIFPKINQFVKDPNNNFVENINNLLNEQKIPLKDILNKFQETEYKSKDIDSYSNIDKNEEIVLDENYDDLFIHLKIIEDNMVQLQKFLKDK